MPEQRQLLHPDFGTGKELTPHAGLLALKLGTKEPCFMPAPSIPPPTLPSGTPGSGGGWLLARLRSPSHLPASRLEAWRPGLGVCHVLPSCVVVSSSISGASPVWKHLFPPCSQGDLLSSLGAPHGCSCSSESSGFALQLPSQGYHIQPGTPGSACGGEALTPLSFPTSPPKGSKDRS